MDDARRRFLKTIAVSGAASSPLLTRRIAPAAEAVVGPKRHEDATGEAVGSTPACRKAVLIGSAEGSLKQAIASDLSRVYQVRAASRAAVRVIASARDSAAMTRTLVRGLDAIVLMPDSSGLSGLSERIDECTRTTYALLQAATQESVRHVVYLSSLAMMVGYNEAFQVDEDWPPIPGDSFGLVAHLGEYVCREFSREGRLNASVLRLGTVIRAEDIAGQPFDPLWVDQRDVARAVSLVLAAQLAVGGPRLGAWSIFHVLSGSPRARFSIERAKRVLGYQPQFQG